MKNKRFIAVLTALCAFVVLCTTSCNPEAKWETKDVHINLSVSTVSAGFVKCSFSTDKEAYYLIAIKPVSENYDPMKNSKMFMTMAIDSAYAEYLMWRNPLLEAGEFNVAPFASHTLQYGAVDYFFTGLDSDQEYWVYAFVVNPETLKPCGKLYLERVKTTSESIIDVHFDYRVKGRWDYIYPVDSLGNIYTQFPYIGTTRDSLTLVEEDSLYTDDEAILYFVFWCMSRFMDASQAKVFYGVRAVENDGDQSDEYFEEGHTYYTALSGYDGSFKQTTIYKFVWTGDSCEYYFRDTDTTNLIYRGNGK